MPRSPFVRFCTAVLAIAALALAQTPQVSWSGETMRLRSATVMPAGGSTFNLTLTMENDNASTSLPTSYRRWWHCEIGNLNPAGTTLVVTIANAGYQDVILPVWAQSQDGGQTFAPYARAPLSAVPTQPSSTQHRFTLVTPPGTNAIRLAKYFPYSVARKDAWLATLATHPRVRGIAVLGQSVQGRPIQRVELTDANVPDAGKTRIWIHAGIHPAETTSYFTVEGLVAWLGSGDPFAEVLLDHAIVEIVPMANPDGVALGNYRTNANSVNLEDEWAAPYASPQPEIVALRSAIEARMGTPLLPGTNPIDVLLNLHSSHNVDYPFHFRHTANAGWNPTTNNSGVLPIVNAIEGQWIAAFRARSAFASLGTTQSSSAGAPSRPFVESMMHDRWSAIAQWTGAAQQDPVMAITFEGTYGLGPDQATWNTEADYRQCGADLGRALADYFGLQLSASLQSYGAPCRSLALQGVLAPSGGGHLATFGIAGAAPNALAFVVLGFQQVQTPLPPPWQACLLRTTPDASTLVAINGLGLGTWSLFLPPWPGLGLDLQVLALDLAQPTPPIDTSNGVELRNQF
jgi:hypothetical protein